MPNSALFTPPVKIRGGTGKISQSWFQAQLRAQSLIYCRCKATVQAGRFNTFSRPKFYEAIMLPLSQRLGNWTKHQILREYKNVIVAPKVCLDFTRVASFWNDRSSKAEFRQNFSLVDPKLEEGQAKCRSQEEGQSSVIQPDDLLRCIAQFWNHSASKVTGIEKGGQI